MLIIMLIIAIAYILPLITAWLLCRKEHTETGELSFGAMSVFFTLCPIGNIILSLILVGENVSLMASDNLITKFFNIKDED